MKIDIGDAWQLHNCSPSCVDEHTSQPPALGRRLWSDYGHGNFWLDIYAFGALRVVAACSSWQGDWNTYQVVSRAVARRIIREATSGAPSRPWPRVRRWI
jgi:hypothetical protein